MFTLVYTMLALAPLAIATLSVLATLAWYAFSSVDTFGLYLASEPECDLPVELTEADIIEIRPAVITLRAFVVDGMQVFAANYADAIRIAA